MERSNEKSIEVSDLTDCNVLPVITHCLPLNIILEKKFLKCIWSIINSDHLMVNNIFKFALNNRRSVLGKNFRYLPFKYKMQLLVIKIGHILIVVFLILYQTVIMTMYL